MGLEEQKKQFIALLPATIPVLQHSITPSKGHESIAAERPVIKMSCTIYEASSYVV